MHLIIMHVRGIHVASMHVRGMVVWYGHRTMVRYGVAWYGMVWCFVCVCVCACVWYGSVVTILWCGMVVYKHVTSMHVRGMVVWYGMVWWCSWQ